MEPGELVAAEADLPQVGNVLRIARVKGARVVSKMPCAPGRLRVVLRMPEADEAT
ncbi:MAG: hypothetical protein AB7D51_10205 [Desulfovibrionaceae bacterium]|jgi:hypothetical protein